MGVQGSAKRSVHAGVKRRSVCWRTSKTSARKLRGTPLPGPAIRIIDRSGCNCSRLEDRYSHTVVGTKIDRSPADDFIYQAHLKVSSDCSRSERVSNSGTTRMFHGIPNSFCSPPTPRKKEKTKQGKRRTKREQRKGLRMKTDGFYSRGEVDATVLYRSKVSQQKIKGRQTRQQDDLTCLHELDSQDVGRGRRHGDDLGAERLLSERSGDFERAQGVLIG